MSQGCMSCGAPDDGNGVLCQFCGKPYSQEIAASAVTCPQCRTPNRGGKQHCFHCNAWLVMACLFCGAASPCNAAQCTRCGEAFQGMAERKAAHDRDARTKSVIDGVVSVVGSIAGAMSGGSVHIGGASPQAQPSSSGEASFGSAGDPSAPRMPSY